MIEDIQIPKVENVHIVAIKEWNKEFTAHEWSVYLINNRDELITTVLVMSRGENDNQKTSTLRHFLGDIKGKSAAKVELIMENVFGFTNEYLVTFFVEKKLFEKRFVFDPHSISEKNVVKLPVVDEEGILAK